uniref:Uncharacterized protein n=1 Tax=Cercocebus atys TaxID=9531 RepID=A0A2K5KSI3_CERAT
LMVCNLAYCGKLEEFKESILQNGMHWACSAVHTEIVEFLLHLGVPVNDKGDAAFKNRHEIAVMLLEGRANPHAKDHYEATALHWAAAKGFDTSKVTIVKEITALIRESESPLFDHE